MRKSIITCALAATAISSPAVFANAQCQAVSKDVETWSLLCSDDGTGDKDYQCNYTIAVTAADGETGNIEANGTVAHNQQGAIIWSAIHYHEANIVSADATGSCEPLN